MKVAALSPIFAATCLAGCTGWRLAPGRLDAPVPNRQPLEIWVEGRNAVVHGVQVRGDTVRAVPQQRPPECESCAIFFPTSAIDSVRERRLSAGRTVGVVIVAALALGIYIGSGTEPLPGPQ
jgi:hypothetical protein